MPQPLIHPLAHAAHLSYVDLTKTHKNSSCIEKQM